MADYLIDYTDYTDSILDYTLIVLAGKKNMDKELIIRKHKKGMKNV